MKLFTSVLLLSVCYFVPLYAHDKGNPHNDHRFKRNVIFPDPTTRNSYRLKREDVGSLNLVNDNAEPIHNYHRLKRNVMFANPTTSNAKRLKREAVGTLNILTNNAQPIHADVKSETDGATGVIEKVTPPKDVIYAEKSLRKSWPLTNRLDLIRSVTRLATLAILVLSAAIEFYPLIRHLYYLYYV